MSTQQKKYVPLCSNNKDAFQACFNPQCNYNCFVCQGYSKCQCKTLHKECDKIDWEFIKERLNKNIIQNSPDFKQFTENIQSLYENLINYFTNAYENFKSWKEEFGLTKTQSDFLRLIQQRKISELTGKSIYQIRKQIKTPSKIVMKNQTQLKQEIELINTFAQTLVLQTKVLYNQSKIQKQIINEQKSVIQSDNRNSIYQKNEEIRQLKRNLINKLIGLNENKSKFLNLGNQQTIQKNIEALRENLNQYKKKTDSRIDKLIETINEKFEKVGNSLKTSKSQNVANLQSVKKQLDATVLLLKQEANKNTNQVNTFKQQVNNNFQAIKKQLNSNNGQINSIKQRLNKTASQITTLHEELNKASASLNQQNKEQKKLINQIGSSSKNDHHELKNLINKELQKVRIAQNGLKQEFKVHQNQNAINFENKVMQFNQLYKNIAQIDSKYAILTEKLRNNIKESIYWNIIRVLKYENLKDKIAKKKKYLIENIKNKIKTALFPVLLNELQSQKNQLQTSIEQIQKKTLAILKIQTQNNLPVENATQQFSKIEKQLELLQKQYETKIIRIFSSTESLKIQTIQKFFIQKIKQVNLLYKASENNFEVSVFWEKCNNKSNALTILKTQFGKIIGGFCPIAWSKSLNGKYSKDSERQSFLFSVTQNQKLGLVNGKEEKTICHNSNYGPIYGGGHDLIIYNKAHQNTSSYMNPGHTFNNGQFSYNNQECWKRLSGQSIGSGFVIEEWQVYEIIFE